MTRNNYNVLQDRLKKSKEWSWQVTKGRKHPPTTHEYKFDRSQNRFLFQEDRWAWSRSVGVKSHPWMYVNCLDANSLCTMLKPKLVKWAKKKLKLKCAQDERVLDLKKMWCYETLIKPKAKTTTKKKETVMSTNVITIEKNVPRPNVQRGTNGLTPKYDFLSTLEIGDSFVINGNMPDYKPTCSSTLYAQAKERGLKVSIRTEEGPAKLPTRIRVWRVDETE